MSNRLYTAAVVLSWVGAMTWLLTDRILPPFLGGAGPTVRASDQIEPVAWRIEFQGKPCGEAILQAAPATAGVKEVHSFLEVNRLPTPESVPLWLRPMLGTLNDLSFTMRTVSVFDAFDSLSSFKTRLVLQPAGPPIVIRGRVDAGKLKLFVRLDQIPKRFEYDWPAEGRLGNTMTPSGRLGPLQLGMKWTQEVYSPLSGIGQPIDLIEAEVVELVRLTNELGSRDVWRVEYRTTDKTGSTEQGRLRAALFVSREGEILKQEAYFFGSSLVFHRQPQSLAKEKASLLELHRQGTLSVENSHGSAFPFSSVQPFGHSSSGDLTEFR